MYQYDNTMDKKLYQLPFVNRSDSSDSMSDSSSLNSSSSSSSSPRKREIVAWIIIGIQFLLLSLLSRSFISDSLSHTVGKQSIFRVNERNPSKYEAQFIDAHQNDNGGKSFYDPPTVYPDSVGLVSRVWHSNGNPQINEDLKHGTCWCSGDEYCMCTPSLAVDVILTAASPNHVWLVQRADTGKWALMGGFHEVGETSEEAVKRELLEEMNLSLPTEPVLFGVYSDPQRESRRHAVSVAYVLDVPEGITPMAGDDAVAVQRVHIGRAIENFDMHSDHRTILRDYRRMQARTAAAAGQLPPDAFVPSLPRTGDGEPIKRSVCPIA